MKAVNYVRKKLRLRCLTRIVMRLWMQVLVNHPLITPFLMNPRVPSHNYSPKNPTSQYPPGRDIWLVLLLVLVCQVMWWDTHLTSSIPDLVMKVYSSPASFLPQPYHANTRFLNDFLYLIQFTASSPKGHSAGYTSSTTHLNKILSHISPRILRPPLNHTMMMMSCFSGMFDRQKAFSLITNQVHCQRFSPSQISDTLQDWTCAEAEFRLCWMNEVVQKRYALQHGATGFCFQPISCTINSAGLTSKPVSVFFPNVPSPSPPSPILA